MQATSSLKKEENFNWISHGIGAVASIFGLYLLLHQNSNKSEYATLSILIYGISLISMFIVSAAYHFTSKSKLKQRFRILDHINIYFLIAGTYTPLALITLIGGHGWTIFCVVWSVVGLGTLFKLFYTGKLEFLSLLLYLIMGWIVVLDFDNLIDYMPIMGIRCLFLGGAFYTIGIVFYVLEKMPFNHFIWHVFVLLGALFHWLMIYLYVV